MRTLFEKSPDLLSVPISEARIPTNCRDEAPKLLAGLKYIFMNEELNHRVFSILSQRINPQKEKLEKRGRKGMGLWEILVLGVMRQGLNVNYDKLHYHANTDKLMRTIMGIETYTGPSKEYGLTTLKDNVSLLDEQTISMINDLVIEYGHKLLKKKEDEALRIKADTFVVETNVHFPTDLNLLWDSARKCIDIGEWFRDKQGYSGWRKSRLWRKEIKWLFRATSSVRRSRAKDKHQRIQKLTGQYLDWCKKLDRKVTAFLETIDSRGSVVIVGKILEMSYYQEMLFRHIDLVERRILNGEIIAAEDKLYSIFETHTEWISKGKSHKPVELGHNVLIATDQFHFIVHHQVVEQRHDASLSIEIARTLTDKFPDCIYSLSFDKGFYSKENKAYLARAIPMPVMPKKGKRTKTETEFERSSEFRKLRYAHSAVESNINQLEHNGLNRCPDKGLTNFKRYTALSVLAYNLHWLGKYATRSVALQSAA